VNADALARLRLIRSERVGPVSFRQLLLRFGSAEAALEALPNLARRAGGPTLRIATEGEARAEMAAVETLGARLIFLGLAPYPTRLAEIEDAPPVLTALGQLTQLDRPGVAIIGARNASAAGAKFARTLAHDLADAGCAVVSGMARGIDAAAHRGALPHTIAAVAGGADVAYPPELAELQAQVGEGGLILAEQPIGVQPQARHFPRRNRIISGLSLGVVVVEAALQSGSLITARFAGEQGREVMAVPGSPLDPRALGGNGLIREGATLIQCAADVLEAVRPFAARPARVLAGVAEAATDYDPSPRDLDRIVALLGPTPVGIDELARQSGVAAGVLGVILTDLELGGRLERHAGGRVALGG